MKRLVAAGLLALMLSTSAQAEGGGPFASHYPPFGCGGYCINFLGRIHQHGPLFNYGPYAGYYPFEPYGPWTSDLRYNPPSFTSCKGCGKSGCGDAGCHSRAWGGYAKATLSNLIHRLNPLAYKCGKDCGWGSKPCETSTLCEAPATASVASAPAAPADPIDCPPLVIAPPAVAQPAAQALPPVPLPPVATRSMTGILTGQSK